MTLTLIEFVFSQMFSVCTTGIIKYCLVFQVYTIVNESRHILVFGIPRINLYHEVKHLFTKYGSIESIQIVTDQLKTNDSGV